MKTSGHSIRRRFALLASSSLGALTVIAICAGGAATLVPSRAFAADECGPLVTDPATGQTSPVTCTAGTYPVGITYSGDTVPLIFQGAVAIPDNGLTVNATTDITINPDWDTGTSLQFTNTSGPAISLTSGGTTSVWLYGLGPDSEFLGTTGIAVTGEGPMNVTLGQAAITGTDPNGYGVYVQNATSGEWDFTSVFTTGTITSAGTGVEMHVDGGYAAWVTVGSVVAAGDGIVVDASNLNHWGGASVTAGPINAGGDGVVITTDNNNAAVTLNGAVSAGSGIAVRINSGSGDASLVIGPDVTLRSDEFDISTTGMLGFNVSGILTSATGLASDPIVQQAAGGFTLSNSGTVVGRIDLTGSTGGATIQNGGTWTVAGLNTLTGSDDTISNAVGWPPTAVPVMVADGNATFDVGAGVDTFTNHGALLIQGGLDFQGLENFTTYKYVVLGSTSGLTSDGQTNDRLAADGATFSGRAEGGISSTIFLDARLSGGSQTNCAAAVVADCVSLVGGSTSGTTHLALNEVDRGAPLLGARIVLVDVSGGTASPTDFVLDSGPVGYRTDDLLGTGLDRGVVFYKFGYDAANQQFGFYAVADHEAFELAPMASQAQDVWYSTTGTWLERNTDLREALADDRGAGPAGWLKVASSKTDRHMEKDFQGDNPGFWTTYKQDTTEVIGGLDLLRAMADDQAFVAGVTLGYAKSDTDFDASPTSTSFKGMTYGAYATWLTGSLFVDGIVQVNKLDVEHKTDWIRAGDFGKGKLTSTGVQVEGGWRIPINENSAYVEPLASLAYVRTQIDDIAVPDAVFNANDATSLRGSVGARISGDVLHFNATTLNIAATGRVWDEFSAKNKGKLVAGGSANLEDDFGGTFGQVALTFGLRSDSGRVSGFFNTGAKFNADYLSYDNAIGVRVRW